MAKILIEHEVDLKQVIVDIFTQGQASAKITIMRTAGQIKSEIDELKFMNRYKNLTYTLEELWSALESLIKGEDPKWKMRIRGYEDKKRSMMHPISPVSYLVAGFYLESAQQNAQEIETNEVNNTEKVIPRGPGGEGQTYN